MSLSSRSSSLSDLTVYAGHGVPWMELICHGVEEARSMNNFRVIDRETGFLLLLLAELGRHQQIIDFACSCHTTCSRLKSHIGRLSYAMGDRTIRVLRPMHRAGKKIRDDSLCRLCGQGSQSDPRRLLLKSGSAGPVSRHSPTGHRCIVCCTAGASAARLFFDDT